MAQDRIVVEWYRDPEHIGHDHLGPYIASSDLDADRFIEQYVYRYWPEAHIKVFWWPHPWGKIATNRRILREYTNRVRRDFATAEPLL